MAFPVRRSDRRGARIQASGLTPREYLWRQQTTPRRRTAHAYPDPNAYTDADPDSDTHPDPDAHTDADTDPRADADADRRERLTKGSSRARTMRDMPTRKSAGILLYRLVGGGLEVLLAHPGGPFFADRDGDVWSIPKGEPDGDEPLLDVAASASSRRRPGIRSRTVRAIDLGSIVQKGGKVVHAWAVEGDLDPATRGLEHLRDDVAAEVGPDRDVSRDRPSRLVRSDRGPSRIKAAQIPLLERLEAALAKRSRDS